MIISQASLPPLSSWQKVDVIKTVRNKNDNNKTFFAIRLFNVLIKNWIYQITNTTQKDLRLRLEKFISRKNRIHKKESVSYVSPSCSKSISFQFFLAFDLCFRFRFPLWFVFSFCFSFAFDTCFGSSQQFCFFNLFADLFLVLLDMGKWLLYNFVTNIKCIIYGFTKTCVIKLITIYRHTTSM